MNSTWGKRIIYSLFGESHGRGIGITMHNVPSGIYIDMQRINNNLKRRATGRNLSSKRKETDKLIILSGEKDGYTTGSPLSFYIENVDHKSASYKDVHNKPRPSHADYAHLCKYGKHADLRGAGHLSARLTAPIVAAGSFLMGIEELKDIHIASQIYQIYHLKDGEEGDFSALENMSIEEAEKIKDYELSILSDEVRKKAETEILKAIDEGDSLGSKLRFSIRGLKAGLGEPFFHSLESTLSQLFFSIPAVKAVEFGLGSGFACLKGSEANDSFLYKKDKVTTSSNHSGGINGGISNSMPVNFTLTFRPTPTISKRQNTVDLSSLTNTEIEMKGRHDACVGVRALAIVEAMCYMGIYELMR